MIKLIHGIPIKIDQEDCHLLTDNYYRNNFKNDYVHRVSSSKQTIYLHREIMSPIPKGMIVDHENRDRRDNRRCNLRLCTYSENALNSPPKYGKKYKGVNKRGRKYVARFRGKYLGSFDSELEAARQYNSVASEYSPLAWLNPIPADLLLADW